MDKWTILREETDYYNILPPTKTTSTSTTAYTTKKRNYGCFKYFRKNLPPLLKSLTSTSNDRTGGYTKLSSGPCCSKLLLNQKKGQQNKVILYAEESWAQSAASTYWIITQSYWRRNGCNIEEVSGYRKWVTDVTNKGCVGRNKINFIQSN